MLGLQVGDQAARGATDVAPTAASTTKSSWLGYTVGTPDRGAKVLEVT
jgi:hypothetical protein